VTAATFEFEPEAFEFDYEPGEDWPEYEPERARPRPRPTGGRPPYRPTVPAPARRPQTYTPTPTTPGTVTRAELTRALQRVAADIDRLKMGARATTSQLNDLSERSGRAFANVRTAQQQQAARFDRGLSSTRELAILSGVLGGGGGGIGLLLLLLLAGDTAAPAPDGQAPMGGGLAGSNTNLLLALALSGALGTGIGNP
jgi:hypothetical protein